MAIYVRHVPVLKESEYNQSLTDLKKDYIIDDVNLTRKVTPYTVAVAPTITGTDDFALHVQDTAPDWSAGVTVSDPVSGDITDELVVDDSGVDLEAEGTYELVYTVREGLEDEASVTVDVVVTYEVFDITYNLDGGVNNVGNPATYTLADSPLALLDPTKAGYTFDGWFSDAEFTTPVTNLVSGDAVLYAKWL